MKSTVTILLTIMTMWCGYLAILALLNEHDAAHEPDIRCINGDLMTSRRVVVDGPDMLQGMVNVCQKRMK